MSEQGREVDLPRVDLSAGGLDGSNLLLAERLADDVKSAGKRRVSEGPILFPWKRRSDRGGKGFLGVGQLSLRLCQCCRDRTDALTGPVHERPPWKGLRS